VEEAFVSDIFHEVDEEIRREQLKKLWDRYGIYLSALAVLVVLAVAGWRAYDWWEAKKAAEIGGQFEAAAQLVDQGKHEEAEKAFARIAAEGTSGYRVLARLREAAELARRDPKAAVGAYDEIAKDPRVSQTFQDLATVRAAMILVDTASLAEMTQRLEPLTAASAPFRHTARGLLALAAWRAGDKAALHKWAELINTDPETPQALRQRIDALTALAGESAKG
jgi:hypothetical protein